MDKTEVKQVEETAWDLCDIPKHPSIESCEQCGNKRCHAMYYAERAYNARYRKSEWISVEERLPKESGDYITFHEHGNVGVIYYNASIHLWNVYYFEDVHNAIRSVTHWMPLPEAPKMKGGA